MNSVDLLKIIKKLQESTGLRMSECLKALKRANYDLEAVTKILKKQGVLKAEKKFNQKEIKTTEGKIIAVVFKDEHTLHHGLLKICCETDYVSTGQDFAKLCVVIKSHVEKHKFKTIAEILDSDYDGEPFKNYLLLSSTRFHEQISLLKYELCEVAKREKVDCYIHDFRIGVVVVANSMTDDSSFSTKQTEILRKISFQICSAKPAYISEADLPIAFINDIVERLRLKIKAELPGKPPEIYEKIVRGRYLKTLKDDVLLLQNAVFDPDKTVGTIITENQFKITKFIRLSIKDS